ncbi:MAG: DNA polymerase III subunit delta [Cellulosilyticum sp.]|nr:DNA polymerase III subunit delta [Cellulosilyticum sp.]MEE1070795.1 DNA polymerase III subunit delta [Cellulosilyticum sp.]
MSKRSGCFLLLGQDHWSKSQYIQKVKQEVLTSAQDIMNYYEAQEKDVQVDKLKDVIETLPFFAEYKLVYLKDTGYFKPGRKEESEKFEALINDLPEYIVLLVDEREADKRSKLYKTMKSNHEVIEFDYPGEDVVVKMLQDKSKEDQIIVEQSTLYYLVRNMPEDVEYILGEWQKLISYVEDGKITRQAIDNVCVFSLETRVFELVKKIAAGKSDEALQIYSRMLQSKESPIGILVLIARQFRVMYQVKYLKAKGQDMKQIAAQTKMPYFAVKEMLDQVSQYSFSGLETLIEASLETDRMLKTGKMEAGQCVELLIMRALTQR